MRTSYRHKQFGTALVVGDGLLILVVFALVSQPGHHLDPGILYNVSGLSAVEITLREGTRFRLGTDEPERLAAALHQVRERPL